MAYMSGQGGGSTGTGEPGAGLTARPGASPAGTGAAATRSPTTTPGPACRARTTSCSTGARDFGTIGIRAVNMGTFVKSSPTEDNKIRPKNFRFSTDKYHLSVFPLWAYDHIDHIHFSYFLPMSFMRDVTLFSSSSKSLAQCMKNLDAKQLSMHME